MWIVENAVVINSQLANTQRESWYGKCGTVDHFLYLALKFVNFLTPFSRLSSELFHIFLGEIINLICIDCKVKKDSLGERDIILFQNATTTPHSCNEKLNSW